MAHTELAFHNKLCRPGTIIDVGANVGTFSMHFSVWEHVRLIAFEPFPPTFERLRAAMFQGHNGMIPTRVTLHRAALGEHQGTARLRIPRTDDNLIDQWASLAKSFEGMDHVSFDEVEVPVWTIDGLGLDDLTAIKVDAEGFEPEVLHGAFHTLRRCRPIVTCELEERHREGVTWSVPGYMRGLGYDGYYFHAGGFRPIARLDRATMQVASPSPHETRYSDPYIHEFYFVPRENPDLHRRMLDIGPIRD